MKRFLEYIEYVEKMRKRALAEANTMTFAYEVLDISDGREWIKQDPEDCENIERNSIVVDGAGGGRGGYGPYQLGRPRERIRYEKLQNWLKFPGGVRPGPSDEVFAGAVEAGRYIGCSPDQRGKKYALFVGLAGGDGGAYKTGYVTKASFNELVTLACKSGTYAVNPRFLYGFVNSAKPVFEEEAPAINITVRPEEGQYSKENIMRLFSDPNSHVNSGANAGRGEKFRNQVLAAKGDLGEVLVYSRTQNASRRQDSILTDKNWLILKDAKSGLEFDAFKCSPRTLVEIMSSSQTIIPIEFKRRWKVWLPCFLLRMSMSDAYAGNLI